MDDFNKNIVKWVTYDNEINIVIKIYYKYHSLGNYNSKIILQ